MKNISNYHYSVLNSETIKYLDIKPNGIYVDTTLGRGGHSKEILKILNGSGLLICIDTDSEAINYCTELFKDFNNVRIIKDNFKNIKNILSQLNIDKIDGIIADLGVSSPQLDNDYRGFSYKYNSRLDMRMDQQSEFDAYELINTYSFKDLCRVFKFYGDIRYPESLVQNIIKTRTSHPITTTYELLEIIEQSLPKKILYSDKNFANKYFQAIRIEVNKELDSLKILLDSLEDILNKNAIACFISFHSLEDKLIAHKFKELTRFIIPKEIPILSNKNNQNYILIKPTGLTANQIELRENNRSRSARLRIIKKIV